MRHPRAAELLAYHTRRAVQGSLVPELGEMCPAVRPRRREPYTPGKEQAKLQSIRRGSGRFAAVTGAQLVGLRNWTSRHNICKDFWKVGGYVAIEAQNSLLR